MRDLNELLPDAQSALEGLPRLGRVGTQAIKDTTSTLKGVGPIVSDPTLLICDEPTGDLDRQSAEEILGLLQTLNREHGKTIVMVTHDPKAAEYATHTLHLDKGNLVESAAHA